MSTRKRTAIVAEQQFSQTLAPNAAVSQPAAPVGNSAATQRGELAWQLMLRRLPALVWTTDRELTVASAGGSGGDFGRDLQTLVGSPISVCLGEDLTSDSPLIVAHAKALLGQASSLDHIFRRKAYRLYLEPLSVDGDIVGCVGMAIDITPRKSHDFVVHNTWPTPQDVDDASGRGQIHQRLSSEVEDRRLAEQALRESHDRLVQLAASIDSAFWIEDRTTSAPGRVIYLSPGYESIWGFRVEDALRAEQHAIWKSVHEDDRHRVQAFLHVDHDGPSPTADFRIRRPDGAIRWVRARAFPVCDATGKVERVAGIAEDITVRKEDEDRERRSERLATLGNFVAGIAHEINNPLGAALAATQAGLRSLPSDSPGLLRTCLDNSLSSIRRCTQIVRSLLRFCRDEPASHNEFDLRDVLAAAETITRSYASERNCQIDVQLADHPLPARGSALEVELVFVNLLRNAIEAGAKRVIVRCGLCEGQIEACVTDDGCGIPREQAWRLGEPFFTTRHKAGGTGLGLSVVHSIVHEHHGRIDFIPQDRGTVVRVVLPQILQEEPL
ncbi:two-component system sensor histidine kinase NtrB [Anatilimnocola aggregata]|uniref:two-component system sensor histidine kinase NtrB n=1 Tax=Anatilimnocola aggregata TaxID=2528021 RepID=UPI00192E74E1|nr:PAS domain-containing sensor histidine kinase [Anatilimnocola aggregata]